AFDAVRSRGDTGRNKCRPRCHCECESPANCLDGRLERRGATEVDLELPARSGAGDLLDGVDQMRQPQTHLLRFVDEPLRLRELARQRIEVELRARLVDVECKQDVDDEGGVCTTEGEYQKQDQVAYICIHLADHPEVEEVDLVLPPQQVPGMRVGVEEADT